MTPTVNNPAKNSVIRDDIPGLTEFGVLMNQFEEPAVMLDNGANQILLPNSEMLKLTAFSRNELISKEISALFPEGLPEGVPYGDEFQVVVKRRNRDSIKMRGNLLTLDPGNKFSLIRLHQVLENANTTRVHPDELALELLQLISLNAESSQEVLDRLVKVALNLMPLDGFAIYQAEASFPQLTRIIEGGEGIHFPETVSSTDLIRLSLPMEWVPGKRVVTDIHRFSRMNNLGYVVTAPIGIEGALLGLVVAGTRDSIPDRDLLPVMEKLANTVNGVFHHFMMAENLSNASSEQQRVISLQESLLNNAKEGILILDPEYRILSLNSAAEEMLGYASREIFGEHVENVLIGPTGLLSALAAANETIPTHDLGNELIHRRNGQAFPAALQVIPVMQNEILQGILIFITDISEHEQIQLHTQQLEQRAFLGELMQVFAHEVRNPINNISMGLQLLGEQYKEDKTSQTVIGNAQTDCTRLIHLMESILAFSRQVEQKYEAVDVGMLLQRLLDRWRPRLTNVNVEPFFQADPDLPKVFGDRRALEQVFVNLFTNSVEAMSETGGTLAIKISKNVELTSQPQIDVSISDTGPGISDEMRARLFEPFATTKMKGTGLGLAITKQIVTTHKGSINVSTFPGGTVFHVYLPTIPAQSGEG
ncbi:MAG: ATP-binding protein [bacterium]